MGRVIHTVGATLVPHRRGLGYGPNLEDILKGGVAQPGPGGLTWPGWTTVSPGNGPMAAVRWDVNKAFENTAMRAGTLLKDPAGTIWEARLFVPGDVNQGIVLVAAGTEPPSAAPAPPINYYQPPRSDVIQLVPSQYSGKSKEQLIAEAGGGYAAFGPLNNQMELVRLDSSVYPLYVAKYAAAAATPPSPSTPPPTPPLAPPWYKPPPVIDTLTIPGGAPGPAPPSYKPPPVIDTLTIPGGAPGPTPANGAAPPAATGEGVPMWVWLVGGGVLLYAMTQRR